MPSPGDQLLHYRFLEEIGRGAMGSVWHGRDESLGRDVALKVLPDHLAEDTQHLARFEREAKLLASLDHPNLAAVFGVHDADGVRFLAMELVPGEDLSTRIARGPLSLEDLARIGGQMAEAIQAAHEKGVIHRDLKPANVRLLPDGRVKVLDFGLAKSMAGTEEGSGTGSQLETTAGVVLGTAPYMSPEQARGQKIDARSDIWSYGCVLYECLTGRRPFRGETVPDLISGILGRDPDWQALPPETPPEVTRVIARCLRKDPGQRFHHIADVRIALEEAVGGAPPELQAAAPPASPPPRGRRELLLALGWVVAAGLLLALWLGGTGSDDEPWRDPLAGAQYVKLTDWPGAEFDAAISADGRFITFVSDREGPWRAFAGEISVGRYDPIAPWMPGDPTMAVRNVGFVGDGSEVWLGGGLTGSGSTSSAPNASGMYSVLRTGSEPRPLLEKAAVNADWSPDGQQVVYHWGNRGDPLYIAGGRGIDPQELRLDTEDGYHQHFPTWSPDGRWIYLTRGWENTGEMDLWRVRPNGQDLEQLTFDHPRVLYPTPLDDRTVLFIALAEDGSGPWLWCVDPRTKRVERLLPGITRFTSISASADGKRLVATVADLQAGLWQVPIRAEEATEKDVTRVDVGTLRARAPRLRGDRIWFLSSVGSRDGLWVHEDGKPREFVDPKTAAQSVPVAISPDGTKILITKRDATMRPGLHIVDAETGVMTKLGGGVVPRGAGCWSPEGDFVVVGGVHLQGNGLYKIGVEKETVDILAKGEALDPVWSPDGRTIVYAGGQINAWMPLKAIDAETKEPIALPDIEVLVGGQRVRFIPGTRQIVYMKTDDTGHDFYVLDLDTQEGRRLTRISPAFKTRAFDIAPDGSRIVFDRMREDADLVLIERDPGR